MKLLDQHESIRGRVDDQGEAEQPGGGGRSAGCRQVHQALRGGRRSLEHGCSFFVLFIRQIYFLFFLLFYKIIIMRLVWNNNRTPALSHLRFYLFRLFCCLCLQNIIVVSVMSRSLKKIDARQD
jgi:hypothetical protein